VKVSRFVEADSSEVILQTANKEDHSCVMREENELKENELTRMSLPTRSQVFFATNDRGSVAMRL